MLPIPGCLAPLGLGSSEPGPGDGAVAWLESGWLACPRHGRAAGPVLLGQAVPDGLVAPELDLDVGLRGPRGPFLVLAVPLGIGEPVALDERGEFVENDTRPWWGFGSCLIPDEFPCSMAVKLSGQVILVWLAGSADRGSRTRCMFSARPWYQGESPRTK